MTDRSDQICAALICLTAGGGLGALLADAPNHALVWGCCALASALLSLLLPRRTVEQPIRLQPSTKEPSP